MTELLKLAIAALARLDHVTQNEIAIRLMTEVLLAEGEDITIKLVA